MEINIPEGSARTVEPKKVSEPDPITIKQLKVLKKYLDFNVQYLEIVDDFFIAMG